MHYLVNETRYPWTDEGLKEAETEASTNAIETKRDGIVWICGPDGSRRVRSYCDWYGGIQTGY